MIEVTCESPKTVGEEFAEFREERRLRRAARESLTRKVRHAVQCRVSHRLDVSSFTWKCPACGEVVS